MRVDFSKDITCVQKNSPYCPPKPKAQLCPNLAPLSYDAVSFGKGGGAPMRPMRPMKPMKMKTTPAGKVAHSRQIPDVKNNGLNSYDDFLLRLFYFELYKSGKKASMEPGKVFDAAVSLYAPKNRGMGNPLKILNMPA